MVRQIQRTHYWIVNVTVVVCWVEPAVPVTVMVYVPAGVPALPPPPPPLLFPLPPQATSAKQPIASRYTRRKFAGPLLLRLLSASALSSIVGNPSQIPYNELDR